MRNERPSDRSEPEPKRPVTRKGRHWSAWCALVVLCVSAPVFGQTATGETEPGPQKATGTKDVAEGILPVPDYAGDWTTRPALTGDWGGVRQDLANKGLTFDLKWLQVPQGIVSGGVDKGWAYATNLDYYLNLDLMRMGVLPGAVISFRGQSRFGATVNEDSGLLLPVNTYSYFPFTTPTDEDVPFAITELNYLQFLSEEVAVLLGKITTMGSTNEFAGGEGRSQFMNFQLLFSAMLGQFVPYASLAAGGLWMPSPNVTVNSLLMNTEDSSTTTGFDDICEGTTWITSVDTRFRLGGLPGGVTAGFAYAFDGDFARLGGVYIDPGMGIRTERESRTWVLFASGWQYLYAEADPPAAVDAADGRQDLEGLGVFAHAGIADEDTNPVSWTVAGGVSGRGSIPGRDDDTWGVGYFYNEVQDLGGFLLTPRLGNTSQGLEAYYNIAIARSVALTVDVQWTKSAFRRIDDALILGARLNIDF